MFHLILVFKQRLSLHIAADYLRYTFFTFEHIIGSGKTLSNIHVGNSSIDHKLFMVWDHEANIAPPPLIEVLVQSHENERSWICVLLFFLLDFGTVSDIV